MEAVVNPESSEGFPSGCWNRGVSGAISKTLWESLWEGVESSRQLSINSSTMSSPAAASTGLLSRLTLVKDKTLGQKGVERELSGKLQGKDGASDDGHWCAECKCVE